MNDVICARNYEERILERICVKTMYQFDGSLVGFSYDVWCASLHKYLMWKPFFCCFLFQYFLHTKEISNGELCRYMWSGTKLLFYLLIFHIFVFRLTVKTQRAQIILIVCLSVYPHADDFLTKHTDKRRRAAMAVLLEMLTTISIS